MGGGETWDDGGSLADDHMHFGRAIINLGTTCNNLPWLGVGSLDGRWVDLLGGMSSVVGFMRPPVHLMRPGDATSDQVMRPPGDASCDDLWNLDAPHQTNVLEAQSRLSPLTKGRRLTQIILSPG